MRFRFRTLLWAIALLGLVFAVVTHYHRRHSAIRQIRGHHGVLTFQEESATIAKDEWSEVFCSVKQIETNVSLNDQELRFALLHLKEVQKLTIRNLDFSLESAVAVGRLPHLEELSLQIVGVSSEQLNAICRSNSLQSLEVLEPLSDEHCEALGTCKSLRSLDISHTNVTDSRVRWFLDLPHLKFLAIYVWNEDIPHDAIAALLSRRPALTLKCSGTRKTLAEWWTDLRRRFPESDIQMRE